MTISLDTRLGRGRSENACVTCARLPLRRAGSCASGPLLTFASLLGGHVANARSMGPLANIGSWWSFGFDICLRARGWWGANVKSTPPATGAKLTRSGALDDLRRH